MVATCFRQAFSHRSGPRRNEHYYIRAMWNESSSVAEWLACWTQSQKGPGSNRSRDAVG